MSAPRTLLLALLITLVTPVCARQAATEDTARSTGGRMRPPAALSCDPVQLTSFSGTVSQYQRNSQTTRLVIETDWDTAEPVIVHHSNSEAPEADFLLFGQPFKNSDWQQVESAPGVLLDGMRATAWVCSDGATTPVVDWRPGRPAPTP